MSGWSTGGACYGSRDEAVQAWHAQFQPEVQPGGPGGTFPMYSMVDESCGEFGCFQNGIITFFEVRTPSDQCPGTPGYCSQTVTYTHYTLNTCTYKGGFEYWSPILAAFFLAGVSLLCARLIAGIFKRETY